MPNQPFKEKEDAVLSAGRIVVDAGAETLHAGDPSTEASNTPGADEAHEHTAMEDVGEAQSASESESLQSEGLQSERPKSERPEAERQHFPDLGERYEVMEQIGAGGMGTIWKVRDRPLDKILAIKILHPEMLKDSAAVKRFEQEARLAADLTHMNIASVYGPGTDKSGNQFIIMNYIDGESLADILAREGRLSEQRSLDIFQQICAALAHSHMKGVIHRDIKPSNIIISKTDSGADLVHVVDFGIAKSIYGDVQATQALTRTTDAMGSPLYISPEQCLGEEVTEQSDIYSVGCVLYEMLTGAPPFKEKNPVKLLLQHLNEEPDLSQVPENCRALLRVALRKGKGGRPKTIEDLLEYIGENSRYRTGPIERDRSIAQLDRLLPARRDAVFWNADRVNRA